MLDPFDLVALATLGVAVAAAVAVVPRPPTVDGARWFKTIYASRLRAAGVEGPALRNELAHHPLGRLLDRKLAHPDLTALPGEALPGERALLTELAALPAAERWARVVDDPVALADLLPGEDDGAMDPARWLGPTWGWPSVVDDPAGLVRRAEQRLGARWVVVPGLRPAVPLPEGEGWEVWSWPTPPSPLRALLGHLTALGTVRRATPLHLDLAATVADLAGVWLAVWGVRHLGDALADAEGPGQLLLAATGEGAPALLEALIDSPRLRDRVLAVVFVGGVLGGWPEAPGPLGDAGRRDWNARWFAHGWLDTEIVRRTPYLTLGLTDTTTPPLAHGGLPVDAQRLPVPGVVGREPETVEVMDLGLVPTEGHWPARWEALRLVADLLALSRRG